MAHDWHPKLPKSKPDVKAARAYLSRCCWTRPRCCRSRLSHRRAIVWGCSDCCCIWTDWGDKCGCLQRVHRTKSRSVNKIKWTNTRMKKCIWQILHVVTCWCCNLSCREHPLKNCHEVTQRRRDLPSEQSGFKRCWTVDLWGFIVLFGHNYLTHANQTWDRTVPVKNMHDRHFVR